MRYNNENFKAMPFSVSEQWKVKNPIFSFLLFQIQTIFSPRFPDKTTKDIGLVDGWFDLYDQRVGFRTYLKMWHIQRGCGKPRPFSNFSIFVFWPRMVGNMLKRALLNEFLRKMENKKFTLSGTWKFLEKFQIFDFCFLA